MMSISDSPLPISAATADEAIDVATGSEYDSAPVEAVAEFSAFTSESPEFGVAKGQDGSEMVGEAIDLGETGEAGTWIDGTVLRDAPVAMAAMSAFAETETPAPASAVQEVVLKGVSLQGVDLGGEAKATGVVSGTGAATSTTVDNYSVASGALEAFGLSLADLGDPSSADAVRSALRTGGDANLVSNVTGAISSTSTSVEAGASAETSVDVSGVKADQATVEIGSAGQSSNTVKVTASATADSVDGATKAQFDGAQVGGFDLLGPDDSLEVGGNWVMSADVAADFSAAAESAAGDADAIAAIDSLLGAGISELLVGGIASFTTKTDVSLDLGSTSQSGDATSSTTVDSFLGLNLAEASGSGDLNGIASALLLSNSSTASFDETSISRSGDASSSVEILEAGGVRLGDTTTGAQVDGTSTVELEINQSAASSGGDSEASSRLTEVYGVQDSQLLETGGSTKLNSTLSVDGTQVAQSTGGAASTTAEGDRQVAIELGTQEAQGNVQLIVTNFLGSEATATSVLATASTEEIQTYLAGLDADSLQGGGTVSVTADTTLSVSGKARSSEDNATAVATNDDVYGIDVGSVDSRGDVTLDGSATSSLKLLADTLQGDARTLAQLGSQEAVAVATLLDGSADAKVLADALATLEGKATSVDGDAESRSQLASLLGLNATSVVLEGDADVLAKLGLSSSNTATSVAGDATSTLVGGELQGTVVGDLDAGGDISLGSDVAADLLLLASSIDGVAYSDASLDQIIGSQGNYSADGSGDLNLGSLVEIELGSSSVAGDASSELTIAQEAAASGDADSTDAITTGSDLDLVASSELTASVEAASTEGSVDVQVDGGTGKALQVDGISNLDLVAGGDLDAKVSADATVTASASTQEGTANTDVSLDVAAVESGSILGGKDGDVSLSASSTTDVVASSEGDQASDDAIVGVDAVVAGYRGDAGQGISEDRNGSITIDATNTATITAAAEGGDSLIAADLHAIGASLANDGFLSLGGTGDISSIGVIDADLIANSQFGDVGIDTTLSARGIGGGEVQGAGLDGSLSGTGLITASLLGLTEWGDADLSSQSTGVGLDHSILGAGFGDNNISGISRVAVESLSSTDHGDASALHFSKSVGVLANDGTPTLVTSGADLVAIAEDSSFVTAMTSQGQATSHSQSETVGISGAEVSLFGEGSLTVSANSKASAISSSNT